MVYHKIKAKFFAANVETKEPLNLIQKFWQRFFTCIEQNLFLLILAILFNFIPYLYLFGSYNQYTNAIGGLFKPFADIVVAFLIIDFLPQRIARILKYILVIINGLLSIIEVFIISKYYTFMTAGIVSVIIGTNPRETVEFIAMYFSVKYILVIVVLAMVIYLWHKYSKRIDLLKSQIAIFLLPCIFLYSLVYTIVPGKNLTECLTFTRIFAPVQQAINDAITFREIYTNMHNSVEIVENKRSIPNVVFILGEATTRNHMGIYGYSLPTTPKLEALKEQGDIYVFNDVISSHAYTIGSLREVFTFHNYEAPNKWYEYNNLFDIVNKAGYKTYWLSNQETSGEWANVALAYANRCDYEKFTGIRQSYEKSYRADGELLPLLYEAMNTAQDKNFYVLHLMGCHGEYDSRYTPEFNKFSADDEISGKYMTNEAKTAKAKYDNAILYNDTIVTSIMQAFKDKNAIVIYMPDHGEEVYATANFSGHSDDNATRSMLEIPFIIYTTSQFRQEYPQLNEGIKAAVNKPYMTDDMIHTVLDIMGIVTPEYQETRSLVSPYFDQTRKRMFLDKNYDTQMKFTK